MLHATWDMGAHASAHPMGLDETVTWYGARVHGLAASLAASLAAAATVGLDDSNTGATDG